MEKVKSKKDVILCRGIWYLVTLLSIFGLSISLNFLWPHGECSSSSSRFLRDGAVSVTTFYAVILLKNLLFTGPDPSTYYREITPFERFSHTVFTLFALGLVVLPLLNLSFSFSLFMVSFLTGGLGVLQLSDKFKMEMTHALMTLFFLYFTWLCVVFAILYSEKYKVLMWFLFSICYSFPLINYLYSRKKNMEWEEENALRTSSLSL